MDSRFGHWLARAWRAAWPALLAICGAQVAAGTLDRAAVEAMFPPPLIVGEKPDGLPAWPVFRRDGAALELHAHVFETIDVEPVPGFAGKPLNLLVVMDRDGTFRESRLLSHWEPMFRSERGTATLAEFASQYRGLTPNHDIRIAAPKTPRSQSDSTATLHGVLAGTVTVSAIDRSILEAAAQVARARAQGGSAGQPAPRGPNDRYRRSGWNALAAAGLIQPLKLTNRQVESAFAGTLGARADSVGMVRPAEAAVNLWIAIASLPQAGRNLLHPADWAAVREAREAGTAVLLVIESSRYPMLDDSPQRWRRSTLRVLQGGREHALVPFADPPDLALSGHRSGVAADSVPHLYAIRPAADGARLDISQPVDLQLRVFRRTGDDPREMASADFSHRFAIPGAADYLPVRETPAWLVPWQQRATDLVVLAIALVVLTFALIRQRWTSASRRRLATLRIAWLAFTLGFIGWWAQGQLTIVSVTSGIEAAIAGRGLGFLLADPVAVVLWAFTGITLLVWGRGSFCGWLCPFGALQELVARIAAAVGWRHRPLRPALDARLKWLKYGVLAAVLGAATLSAAWTERAVEVEPFKTAISLYFAREWPYVLWAAACVVASVLAFRGYCRYLCPLGALLAVLGRLRRWGWIPRHAQCGSPCQTCRHRCEYQAIAPSGRVDYAECFQCLDCVAIHQDDQRCLPLVLARRHRTIPIHAHGATT